jgi:hypothetical protein
MLKKLMNDIKSIRAGTYVDEGALVEDEKAAPPPEPPVKYYESSESADSNVK